MNRPIVVTIHDVGRLTDPPKSKDILRPSPISHILSRNPSV
jgi:hypothetical protein